MSEKLDMSNSIVPKSDQLNADDLIAGAITVKITGVKLVDSKEQPAVVDIEGYRPYKPCKMMRRALVTAWGVDGRDWVGKSLTLYREHTVKWAGEEVGGIRISRMSHIDKDLKLSLTVTRGSRKQHTIAKIPDSELMPVVKKLVPYPVEKFHANLFTWNELIETGKKTRDDILAQIEKAGHSLTESQLNQIIGKEQG